MRLWQRLLSFRRSYFLPSGEFEQYLKDALRQQEKRSRWVNVICLDLLLPEGAEASSYNIEKTLKAYALDGYDPVGAPTLFSYKCHAS